MQTSRRIRIDPAELHSLATQWREQEWDLRSAGEALAATRAGSVGAVGMGGFLAVWGAELDDLAVAVGTVADGLAAAGSDFVHVDGVMADR